MSVRVSRTLPAPVPAGGSGSGAPGTAPSARAAGEARARDVVAVLLVARLRIGVLVAAGAVGSFVGHPSTGLARMSVVAALVFLPFATAVLFAAERVDSRLALVGGPLADVSTLFALEAFLPASAPAVLLGYLVAVAFSAFTAGRAAAGLTAAVAMGATLIAQAGAAPPDRLAVSVIVPFSATLIVIVLLLDRATTLRLRALEASDLWEGTSDAILSRVADAVVVTDPRGQVERCNAAARRTFGSDPVGQRCGTALGLCSGHRPFDCSAGCALLDPADDATSDDLGREVWRITADGRRQPLLANAAAVLDIDGNIQHVVHSMRDITRLKQAEEAKTLFLATASHELKTPLTVINGFAETLLSVETDEDSRQMALEAIQRRGVELSKIVDRLLLSSRIEAGRIDLVVDDVALGPIVAERASALSASTGRVVDCFVEDNLDPVRADGEAVATVVDHLIDNAIKYSPGGGPIRITASSDSAAGEVTITVSDTGVGMDRDESRLCFDKFWQAESTDVRRFGGTGIGLYIVRSLVEAMRGRIEVESSLGAGSTFAVTLPAARPAGPVCPGDGQRAGGADQGADAGEPSMIREFMRQIGVPATESAGSSEQ